MPFPIGVVSGPLMATLLRRIDSSTCTGIGLPNFSMTSSPASCTSHSMSTPVASITRRAAELTSGPTPSPGISVIACRAMYARPPERADPASLTVRTGVMLSPYVDARDRWLVRPQRSASPPVAGDPRSLGRTGQRGDAAADAGRAGAAEMGGVHGAL